METIAVYWEPIIRAYGITEISGQTLCRLRFPLARLADWGEILASPEIGRSRFRLCQFLTGEDGSGQLTLVFDDDDGQIAILSRIREALQHDRDEYLLVDAPVELLYLHGPHFQDRYGIADAVVAAIAGQGIGLLAAGCTGTSIYVVVPTGTTGNAVTGLTKTFTVNCCGTR